MIIEYKNLMLDVEYTFTPAYRGEYDGPQQISPDEPAEVEIDQIMLGFECLDELITPEQRDEIKERILNQLEEEEREARIQAEIDKELP